MRHTTTWTESVRHKDSLLGFRALFYWPSLFLFSAVGWRFFSVPRRKISCHQRLTLVKGNTGCFIHSQLNICLKKARTLPANHSKVKPKETEKSWKSLFCVILYATWLQWLLVLLVNSRETLISRYEVNYSCIIPCISSRIWSNRNLVIRRHAAIPWKAKYLLSLVNKVIQ